MKFNEQLSEYYNSPDQHLRMSYQQLISCNMDIGFTSVIKEGRDFHQITCDIVLSVMRFCDHHLTNLLFSQGAPIRLELEDSEIISYFSDYIELRYIISGHLEIELEGKIVCFEENEICFIDSMAYHKELISTSNCVLLNISIERNVFNNAFLNNVGLSPLQQFLRSNIMKQSRQQHYLKFTPNEHSHSESIQEYLSNVFFEVKNRKPGYLDISKGYIIRLMDYLSAEYKYNFNYQDSQLYNKKLFESVSDFMVLNISSVTMKDLTEAFHYQPNYFNNLIKKFTGLTYSHYLISLRIERAKSLLDSTQLPIDEVMWLVGYNNKGFFYKKFIEIVGMSPAKYRTNPTDF